MTQPYEIRYDVMSREYTFWLDTGINNDMMFFPRHLTLWFG